MIGRTKKGKQNDKRRIITPGFFETCAVDYGGRVDSRRMNKSDFAIIDQWKKDGYVLFGRIYSKDIPDRSHWVEFSNLAWNDAHAERKARFKRMNDKRKWRKTEEALLETAEAPNTQSMSVAQISEEMEQAASDVSPSSYISESQVMEWARQLREADAQQRISVVPQYLQNIIRKIDDATEAARKNGSVELTGFILARLIILQETML